MQPGAATALLLQRAGTGQVQRRCATEHVKQPRTAFIPQTHKLHLAGNALTTEPNIPIWRTRMVVRMQVGYTG